MDLFSLFKFLRCSPFDNLNFFNAQVTHNWKQKSDPISVAKLKTLVNCLSLRRPKTTIELLPRTDDMIYLEFKDQEWEDYRQARAKTRQNIERLSQKHDRTIFGNALKWINELRLICNHGGRDSTKTVENEADSCLWGAQEAQTRFDQLDDVGLARCSNFQCCQDLSSSVSDENDASHYDEPCISDSLELWCSSCSKGQDMQTKRVYKICNHLPRQHQGALDMGKSLHGAYPSPPSSQISPYEFRHLPTKIAKLLENLLETPEDIKRLLFCTLP
ncbi:MAG: hypothetical protein Q9164_004972 [Protoblastenia rupestris]